MRAQDNNSTEPMEDRTMTWNLNEAELEIVCGGARKLAFNGTHQSKPGAVFDTKHPAQDTSGDFGLPGQDHEADSVY